MMDRVVRSQESKCLAKKEVCSAHLCVRRDGVAGQGPSLE